MKAVLVLLLCLLVVVPTSAQTYNITTVVGGGSIVGDGLDAAIAKLSYPNGVVIGFNGEIYISDTDNNRIRKISTNGTISTIAGTGQYGYNGDGMLATSAQLRNPYGIALSLNGEIYIADSYNHRIRKISTNGIISTIAGTGQYGYNGDGILATSSQLKYPNGIALSSTGEIYISDTDNHRIRKISTNGIISTIAGTGQYGYNGDGILATSSQLKYPYGIVLSLNGEMYIADTYNNRIRKISTNGTISTIAGTGQYGYNGDGILATSSQLKYPYGIALSSTGEIYISDTDNHRIRKISTNGIISTIAGTGQYGYNGDGILATSSQLKYPYGIVLSLNGEMYIADTSNHRIRKISTNGTISTIAGSARFDTDARLTYVYPTGTPTFYNGTIMYTDKNGRVAQVDLATNFITTLVSVSSPTCVKYYNSEYYVLYDKFYIVKVPSLTTSPTRIAGYQTTPSSGYNGDGILATAAQLYNPRGIALSSTGEIYFADSYNHRIRKISTNGIISTIAGTGQYGYNGDGMLATSAQLGYPYGIALSSNGEIYIADTNNHRIRKISTNGTISTIAGTGQYGYNGDGMLAASAQLYYPRGIALSSNDEIYISDTYNHRIRKISTNGIITTIAGTGQYGYNGDGMLATSAQLNYPYGIALSLNGEIYIADSYNHRIRKISTNGIISTIAGNGQYGYNGDGILATSSQLYHPYGIALSSNDEIYISDTYNNRIRKISTNGIITTIAGTGVSGYNGDSILATSAQFNSLAGVSINTNGEIYIADTYDNMIRKISTNGTISTIAGNIGDGRMATTAYINALAFEFSDNGEIYIADTYNNRIRKISTNGTISTIAGTGVSGYNGDSILATSAQLNYPYGIALSSKGEIYIADTNNHRIRKISTNGIITTIAGTGVSGYNGGSILAASAQLYYPRGIALSSNDEIYISDTYNHRIRKISTNGIISTIAGTGQYGYNGDGMLATSAQLNYPTGVSINTNGEIFVSDTENKRIRKIALVPPVSLEYQCFNLMKNDSKVCSSHGVCTFYNKCSCFVGYRGEQCSEMICQWEDDAISAKTPTIESSIVRDGLKFTTSFAINDKVDYKHLMFIGESRFEDSMCSIVGNGSIVLTKLQQVGCSNLYETLVLTIADLLQNSNVKKELKGDYLKLTVPITLSYLDSSGVSNNGFCRGYTFYTTQTVYFKIIANIFSSYQQNFNYIYGVKVYPQSFSSNSDGTLNIGLVFESMNCSLNSLSFYNSSNPSLKLQMTEKSYLYSSKNSNYFKIGGRSLSAVSDLRSLVYFQANLTYPITKELIYTFASIKIDYSIIIPPSDKNLTLQASISINDQNWTPQNTFKENERIFVQVSTPTLLNDYHLKVNDAFLCCFKEFTSTPTYNPSQGLYACSKYDSNIMSVWKTVVSDGLAADLETLFYPFAQVNNLYGFSFKLLESLFPDRIPRTCYVQANVGLVSKSSRRLIIENTIISNVKSENTSPHTIGMFVSQLTNETILNNATSIQISIFILLISIFTTFM